MKSQSAMEYLMTYGWAILVIAVVLAALYSLGIFNPSTFAPKASAGSCEVVRPFGPTTTTDIHLEGTCTNMLPKYVAQFNGKGSTGITLNTYNFNTTPFTISFWEYYLGYTTCYTSSNGGNCGENVTMYINPNKCSSTPNYLCVIDFDLRTTSLHWFTWDRDIFYPVQTGKWLFITWTYNPANKNNISAYLNGKFVGGNTGSNVVLDGQIELGEGGSMGSIDGYVSNFQIYNSSLSANQISALYDEGIGGDPIDLTHLVAWYPLNGNAQDYSGNNYNGKAFNVSYSSTWYRTYSAP
ncbi:LamG domain protein [Candidatus Mancarchaeum acidiphilum]|uniref:LamG domain protein n=1 Tax=Candidatus Mancarchaeum acidiphilum TaxID=1920749 RepID=A0A218NN90_9ARCH|nr:LamG-like jellyroll fold domain-containing protein [Candidatus Mancarchaeum acidiphilum]ASI13935.1 LamG domain protein [Candidatus Mancarchaeum acidiphilum]